MKILATFYHLLWVTYRHWHYSHKQDMIRFGMVFAKIHGACFFICLKSKIQFSWNKLSFHVQKVSFLNIIIEKLSRQSEAFEMAHYSHKMCLDIHFTKGYEETWWIIWSTMEFLELESLGHATTDLFQRNPFNCNTSNWTIIINKPERIIIRESHVFLGSAYD